MNFQQVRHPIDYVIQRVRTGRLALPDFQRDFVWNPSEVVELLDSVSKQWPIGSLLLLSGPQPFAFRPIDSAPKINSGDLDLYILDGQQRVTALFHAVANVSNYCYYVDFNDLEAGGYDAIRWERRPRFEKLYPDIFSRAKSGIALVKDIWDHSEFFSWLSEVRSNETKEKYIRLREDRLTGLQSKVYHIMAIELEQGIELEALARIFETINKTGIPLNAFDLLVAKLYPTTFNLRDAWDQAKEKHDVLVRFEPDELEVLKLISLLIRKNKGRKFSKGVRQGDLLTLESTLIIEYWNEAVDLYARTLKEMARFGVTATGFVPNWAMVLGMAGCLLNLNDKETDIWWSSRLCRQTFAQAANTKIVAEFDSQMQGETGEGYDPAELLSKPARANGLFTRGLLAMVSANGGLDPLTGKPLLKCDKVAFLWVGPSGEIRRLTADDDIAGVLAMSEDAGKTKLKGINIKNLEFGVQALQSQGIETVEFKRTASFTRKILGVKEEQV